MLFKQARVILYVMLKESNTEFVTWSIMGLLAVFSLSHRCTENFIPHNCRYCWASLQTGGWASFCLNLFTSIYWGDEVISLFPTMRSLYPCNASLKSCAAAPGPQALSQSCPNNRFLLTGRSRGSTRTTSANNIQKCLKNRNWSSFQPLVCLNWNKLNHKAMISAEQRESL